LKLYFNKLIVNGEDAGDDAPAQGILGALGIGVGGKRGGGKKGSVIVVDGKIGDETLIAAAQKMDGFSGREIAKTIAGGARRRVRSLLRHAHADLTHVRARHRRQGGGTRQKKGGVLTLNGVVIRSGAKFWVKLFFGKVGSLL